MPACVDAKTKFGNTIFGTVSSGNSFKKCQSIICKCFVYMYNACPCFLQQKCSTKVKLWLTKTTSVKSSCYFFLLLYKKSIKRWLMACSSMEVQWEKIIVNRKISSRLSVDSNYVIRKELSRHRKISSLSTPNDFPTMLSGGGSWDPTWGEQTMGPQDCGGRRCCNSYEGIARITSLFYIF